MRTNSGDAGRRLNALRKWLPAVVLFAFSVHSVEAIEEFKPCKNNYSPQQQVSLGDKAKAQVYKTTPVLPDSSPVTQYIQQLGGKLTAHAPGYRWPYNFHVANEAEINAFALPGGSIFVNLGAIQAAETEAELAGVMAHETSHVVLQHSVCNAEKQEKVGLFAGLGQAAAGVLLGQGAAGIVQEGIGLTTGLGFLKMSRGAEREADLEGARIEYDSGYDPHGLPQFFQIIQSKYGQGGAQFMSDHPNPGNRTEYVDQEIATFAPRTDLITTSPEFSRIKTMVAGMHAYTAKEVASGAWQRQSPNESVGNAVNDSAGPQTSSYTPDLSVSTWKTFRGTGFSLDIPANWKTHGNQSSIMIGPQGGIERSAEGGAGNVIYGFLTDQYSPPRGLRGEGAVAALLSEISTGNPDFSPGRQSTTTINGASARSVECENASANNGRGEHDWVVSFEKPDGTLRYFVFVAPKGDFEKLRPTFRRIAGSIRLQ